MDDSEAFLVNLHNPQEDRRMLKPDVVDLTRELAGQGRTLEEFDFSLQPSVDEGLIPKLATGNLLAQG